jgi:WD40-like Beta Propeller Repeat
LAWAVCVVTKFLHHTELNPVPLIDSPLLYSTMLAITVAVLVFIFLRSIAFEESPPATALHWAALVPLLLLLSTTTAVDYSCLLIFTTIVASDALLAMGKGKKALTLLFLYVIACAPIPDSISHWFPFSRLAATTGIYGLLIHWMTAGRRQRPAALWVTLGLIFAAVLTLYTFEAVRNRAESFSGRVSIPGNGYRYADPVPITDGIAFTEMEPSKYAVGILSRGKATDLPMTGDALSLAASEASDVLYAEQAARTSTIVRFSSARPGTPPETLFEGQEPALSPNGKWLAFIREEQGVGIVELLPSDSHESPQAVVSASHHPLDITVTDEGDVIAASGSVSNPHIVLVRHETGDISELREFGGSVRYPSISPDGKRLAFSRRNRGSWRLFVRTLATGEEQQLTHALCNATSPSWVNLHTLLYATDCGRGVGLSALARVAVPN